MNVLEDLKTPKRGTADTVDILFRQIKTFMKFYVAFK